MLGFLVVYLALKTLLLGGMFPLWQGPDEPGHLAFTLQLAGMNDADRTAALEQSIVASLAAHRFFSFVYTLAPASLPARLDEIARLGGHPDQRERETAVGYLPYVLAATAPVCRQAAAVDACLAGLRLVSVLLAVVCLLAMATALAAGLSTARGLRGARGATELMLVLLATWPLVGQAGAIVNNDLPAMLIAILWWGLWWRRAPRWSLLGLALLGLAAKRSAGYLLIVWAVDALVSRHHRTLGADARDAGPSSPPKRSRAPAPAIAALGAALVLGLGLMPRTDDAAHWQDEGIAAGGVWRTAVAARQGGAGLLLADESTAHWRYAAQSSALLETFWVEGSGSVPKPREVRVDASVWVRLAAPLPFSSSMVQLVVNDDRGTWLADTRPASTSWQRLSVRGRLAAKATAVRLAIVPGDGTIGGTGWIAADDAALLVDGRETLANGGFEAPDRWGSWALGSAGDYLDLGRLARAASTPNPSPHSDAQQIVERFIGAAVFLARSSWDGFGWSTIWAPRAYQGMVWLLLLIIAGIQFAALLTPRRLAVGQDEQEAFALRLMAMATLCAAAIAVVGSTIGAPADQLPQGRYLLPAAVPLFFPLAVVAARRPAVGLLLASILFMLDAWATWYLIWPAFRSAI